MSTDEKVSDELLNAFVDNELDTAEWTALVVRIQKDGELAARICELRQHKDMIKMAYRHPPHPMAPESAIEPRSPLLFRVAATVIVLLTGMLMGWMGYSFLGEGPPRAMAAAEQAEQDPKGIVIHIATADPDRLKAALDDAEKILRGYRDQNRKVRLEIVANAEGIDMLRADASLYADRIRRMASDYDNLAFLACSRTIEKLRLKGIAVRLLPEAEVIPGALEEIVTRLQDGWVYIKV